MNDKKTRERLVMVVIGIAVIVLFMAAAKLALSSKSSNEKVPESKIERKSKVSVKKPKAVKSVGLSDGKTPDKRDKEGAVHFTQQLLTELAKDPKNEKRSVETRIAELASENKPITNTVSQRAVDAIRFADYYQEDKSKKNVLIVLLSLVNAVQKANPSFTYDKNSSYMNNVYFDEGANLVFIPLDIFARTQTVLAVEVVYVDNKWQLAPFSLASSARLLTVANQAIKGEK